ncbi:RNA-directed DNA polymerase, eukaryota, partial [Tanacetum coccineum]
MESVSAMEVKFLWGNYFFDHIISEASGNSGGILCAWDTNFFKKDHHTISDNFIALYGTWIPNNQKLLIISVYAPQSVSSKRMLWSYLESLITSWNGESLIMGDFNEVRCIEERWGSVFNSHGANAFNSFISNSGLNDIQLEGFSFTWAHPSATKMSKLDRFLMSNGLLSAFPLILAICLDRHLSDHMPILLKEVFSDFGPTPFCFYHSWLELPGFDDLVSKSWNSFTLDDSNGQLKVGRNLEAGIFSGYKIDSSTTLSHLFYADDAVFIGEWSHSNLRGIMNILRCFSFLSGMSINIQKSHLLGVGIPDVSVTEAANSIGCSIMKAPFKYLGILVGENMSSIKAWGEIVAKMKKRLSRWKLNTLSVGGRLTLLKSVLGSTPIYNMSIFKVPKFVLNYMESLRRNFFNGVQEGDRKIAWVKWSKVLASKKFEGLGVSSFFALNRALLFKWVWRYLSHDNSLWSRIISALHGLNGHVLSAAFNSTWSSIITEVNSLKVKGVDLISHCKIRVGKGTGTSFWKDLWIGDNLLKLSFPRLFALEENKDISVADKMNTSISSSFRRHVRGGVESQQLDQLSLLLDTVILSNMDDRWFWDLNGDGVFQVKDVRSMLDEAFLPKMEVPTRWIKSIPIKVNVFAWKLYLDRLPTRSNLSRRNVSLPSLACPLCDHVLEDSSHLFFGCSVAKDIQKLICRWWNLDVHPYESYEDWLSWFKSIRLGSKTKEVLEGVFYVS